MKIPLTKGDKILIIALSLFWVVYVLDKILAHHGMQTLGYYLGFVIGNACRIAKGLFIG